MPRTALHIILSAIAALIAAGALYVVFFTNHVFVTTPSMYPTIKPGAFVFIEKERTYHVGDVIEFHGNGLVFMHRIVGISPDGDITTKGDNPQNAPDVFDPPTTAADVIGKVSFSIPWAGFPELIARHPGYGLAWLRTELGLRGRLALLLLSGLVFFVAVGDRGRLRRPRAVSEQL